MKWEIANFNNILLFFERITVCKDFIAVKNHRVNDNTTHQIYCHISSMVSLSFNKQAFHPFSLNLISFAYNISKKCLLKVKKIEPNRSRTDVRTYWCKCWRMKTINIVLTAMLKVRGFFLILFVHFSDWAS